MNLKQVVRKLTAEQLFYMTIAVVGFVSSVATLFIDVESQISIKWILFVTCVYLTTTIFLIRLVVSVATARGLTDKIKIIQVYEDKGVLAVRSGSEIAVNSLLSIYERENDYEQLIGIGYVQNKQENGLLSVRIIKQFSSDSIHQGLKKRGLIKTTLPYDLLFNLESENG